MRIHPTAFVHPRATLIGDVTIGARSSVWPGAVIRADSAPIVIGEGCNVQDGSVLHVDEGFPIEIGAGVSIGHRAILHGCRVGSGSLIGMGAILLNGVQVGSGSLVGAGALCLEGMMVPPQALAIGSPARVLSDMPERLKERIARTAANYVALREAYREGKFPMLE